MNKDIMNKLHEAHKLSGIDLENIIDTYTNRVTKLMDRDHKKYRCTNWLDSDYKYGEQASSIILRYYQMKGDSYKIK